MESHLTSGASHPTFLQRIDRLFDRLEALYEKSRTQRPRRPSNRGIRRWSIWTLIYICWAVIVVKCFAAVWAVDRLNIPFSPMWVVVPTLIFALTVTTLYCIRKR